MILANRLARNEGFKGRQKYRERIIGCINLFDKELGGIAVTVMTRRVGIRKVLVLPVVTSVNGANFVSLDVQDKTVI